MSGQGPYGQVAGPPPTDPARARRLRTFAGWLTVLAVLFLVVPVVVVLVAPPDDGGRWFGAAMALALGVFLLWALVKVRTSAAWKQAAAQRAQERGHPHA
jgi:uncharacterized membrane protein YqjE